MQVTKAIIVPIISLWTTKLQSKTRVKEDKIAQMLSTNVSQSHPINWIFMRSKTTFIQYKKAMKNEGRGPKKSKIEIDYRGLQYGTRRTLFVDRG